MLSKIKIGLLLLLGLLALIVVFQNLSEVEVHLLFVTVTMRQATLMFCTLVVGFFMGLVANTVWKVRSWRAKKAKSKVQEVKVDPASQDTGLV